MTYQASPAGISFYRGFLVWLSVHRDFRGAPTSRRRGLPVSGPGNQEVSGRETLRTKI